MPEGDTIHELAAVLREELPGRVLRAVRVQHQPVASAPGNAVDEVFALGKHLFVAWGGVALRTHLGMHGSWHRYRPGERWRAPRWSAAAELAVDGTVYVCFRAREAELVDLRGQRHRAFLRRLGPDLLAPTFDPGPAVQRARELLPPSAAVCDVLLDQRVAAGIGNVYKCELLFLRGWHPLAPQSALDDEEHAELWRAAREALRANLGPGPRSTRGRRPSRAGSAAGPDDPRLWVYHRGGEPCLVCSTRIEYARLGRHLRATWWCPDCQARGAPSAG